MKRLGVKRCDELVPGVLFRQTALKYKKHLLWIVLRKIGDFELMGTDGIPVSNRLRNKFWARPLLPVDGCFCQPKLVCFDLIISPDWVKLYIPKSAKECRSVAANLMDYDSEKYAEGEAATWFMDHADKHWYEIVKRSNGNRVAPPAR